MSRLFLKKWRGQRDGRAQSTVEFALIAWPFFMLLLATTDYAQFYFYEHSLRYAMSTAGRYATPGLVLSTNSIPHTAGQESTDCPVTSSYAAGQWISRYESIRRTFSNNCSIQFTRTQLQDRVKVTSWPGTNSATETSPNLGPGMAGDFVKISVTYNVSLITPVASLLKSNGVYTLNVSGIFLNEPSQLFVINTNYYAGETP